MLVQHKHAIQRYLLMTPPNKFEVSRDPTTTVFVQKQLLLSDVKSCCVRNNKCNLSFWDLKKLIFSYLRNRMGYMGVSQRSWKSWAFVCHKKECSVYTLHFCSVFHLIQEFEKIVCVSSQSDQLPHIHR